MNENTIKTSGKPLEITYAGKTLQQKDETALMNSQNSSNLIIEEAATEGTCFRELKEKYFIIDLMRNSLHNR